MDGAKPDFSSFGPGVEGSVDDGGEDGYSCSANDQGDAGLDFANMSVLGAAAFGEDIEDVAFFEATDGFFDGADVTCALLDGKCAEPGDEPVQEGRVEKLALGEKTDRAAKGNGEEHGVEIALVIGSQKHAATFGEVLDPVELDVKEEYCRAVAE